MIEKYSEKYPAVDNLLCCYFNQDWGDDYDSPEAVIQGFSRSNGRNWVKQAVTEFKALLKEEHTQKEWLRIIYDDFGCFCNPEHGGMQSTDWLKKVQKQFEDELALAEMKEEK